MKYIMFEDEIWGLERWLDRTTLVAPPKDSGSISQHSRRCSQLSLISVPGDPISLLVSLDTRHVHGAQTYT